MKPPPFEYHDPTTLDEALTLLGELGDDAKALAGGQSLVPLLNFRLARPTHLIDLNRIAELAYIRNWDDGVAIGAMTRQWQAERDGRVAHRTPLLRQAIQHIGHLQIRNRGTIGGSLAHADPAAELAAVAAALDAQLVVRSQSSERVLAPDEFFLTYLTTSLDPTELLVEVRVPALPPRSGTAFVELSRRRGDFALVGVAAALALGADDRCTDARLALIGVAPTAVRGRAGEAALRGELLSPERFRDAAHLVAGGLEPDSDVQASGEYRKEVAGVLVRRALEAAYYNVARANQP